MTHRIRRKTTWAVAVAAAFAAVALGATALAPAPATAGANSRSVISTEDAPAAIGPYSQGIRAGNTIYVSGQLPIDPSAGAIDHTDSVTEQTGHSIDNIRAVLKAAGADLDHVVSVSVFLADMDDFAEFNREYERHFGTHAAPARATVEVARLPQDAKVEISAIAVK